VVFVHESGTARLLQAAVNGSRPTSFPPSPSSVRIVRPVSQDDFEDLSLARRDCLVTVPTWLVGDVDDYTFQRGVALAVDLAAWLNLGRLTCSLSPRVASTRSTLRVCNSPRPATDAHQVIGLFDSDRPGLRELLSPIETRPQ